MTKKLKVSVVCEHMSMMEFESYPLEIQDHLLHKWKKKRKKRFVMSCQDVLRTHNRIDTSIMRSVLRC